MSETPKKAAKVTETKARVAVPNYEAGTVEVKVVDPKDKTEIVFTVENK